ncbi:uncharacterized protein LY89DRAFT_760850 [Mollisia scopiformis]|uniref:Uncharacterized protein n=1 Tax=Mollisia scopiformis TaxID=149040 RepID=A0A132BEC5_MOLSC|nr:uncharacterized protein LY89DRAFT_760850 [Mollisia scopiformis]KUJ10027.1 hypothetical protein LY89DRAFT_760850 [Mollisia scopiformis]
MCPVIWTFACGHVLQGTGPERFPPRTTSLTSPHACPACQLSAIPATDQLKEELAREFDNHKQTLSFLEKELDLHRDQVKNVNVDNKEMNAYLDRIGPFLMWSWAKMVADFHVKMWTHPRVEVFRDCLRSTMMQDIQSVIMAVDAMAKANILEHKHGSTKLDDEDIIILGRKLPNILAQHESNPEVGLDEREKELIEAWKTVLALIKKADVGV